MSYLKDIFMGSGRLRLILFLLLGLGPSVSQAAEPARKSYWLFFTDKGSERLEKRIADSANNLLPKARARRAKVLPADQLAGYSDLPVQPAYIETIKAMGFRPITVSKWLNAISLKASLSELDRVANLPFISHYQPVLQFTKPDIWTDSHLQKPASHVADAVVLDYGISYPQNSLIHVPEAHALGFDGSGVLVAIFDSGFRLNHEAFSHLRVIKRRDFINGDNNIDIEPQDPYGQVDHGTKVFSILAGYSPGKLIGPAYGADFLLAKTEDVSQEVPVEENHWIAAAEWADSLGADIISSSVGYMDWYTYANMDGDTAPITRAADLAAQKGILVFNSAGNEGDTYWRYIIAPADGDSVIAVGAVDQYGYLAALSSHGPTSDGRIKPDVVAMGLGVVAVAVPQNNALGTAYTYIRGTSASCPQAAGVAALILSAYPQLTPMEIRDAMRRTADRALNPDNLYGYGLIHAYDALIYAGKDVELPRQSKIISCYPNPYPQKSGIGVRIVFDLAQRSYVYADIYNIRGERVVSLFKGVVPAGKDRRILWDGRDHAGNWVASGIYICRVQFANQIHMDKITVVR